MSLFNDKSKQTYNISINDFSYESKISLQHIKTLKIVIDIVKENR